MWKWIFFSHRRTFCSFFLYISSLYHSHASKHTISTAHHHMYVKGGRGSPHENNLASNIAEQCSSHGERRKGAARDNILFYSSTVTHTHSLSLSLSLSLTHTLLHSFPPLWGFIFTCLFFLPFHNVAKVHLCTKYLFIAISS